MIMRLHRKKWLDSEQSETQPVQAVKSNASTLDEVIAEVAASRITERDQELMIEDQKPQWKTEKNKDTSKISCK